jgi:NAD(P)-dependent dehydrogenase (short-subunit alcohol dehydrogenase family)
LETKPGTGELEGHAVVITGAGGGLGAAYAKAAAALGAKIVINDINREAAESTAAEIRRAHGVAVAETQDIRNPDAAEALVRRCVSEFSLITGLVNNAGVFFNEPLEEASVEHLRLLLEVNVIGTFNCARAAVGPMLRQGRGSIVNVTSGAHTGQQNLSSYGASKGAVASFTYGWSCELRDRGIRVNAVSPLAFTPMAKHLPHLPRPEANVAPVLYLLSDRSTHINGQIIRIAGKRLSLMSHPANRAPILERDEWSLESVTQAFDTTLADKQLPTDVVTYEIDRVFS